MMTDPWKRVRAQLWGQPGLGSSQGPATSLLCALGKALLGPCLSSPFADWGNGHEMGVADGSGG